jgi:hypothetical protein
MENIACTRSTGYYKNVEQRRDGGCCRGEDSSVSKEAERRSRDAQLEEGCIKGIWCREYKRQKNRKCKGRAEETDADRTE